MKIIRVVLIFVCFLVLIPSISSATDNKTRERAITAIKGIIISSYELGTVVDSEAECKHVISEVKRRE